MDIHVRELTRKRRTAAGFLQHDNSRLDSILWPCDGHGDESGNFVCKKDEQIAALARVLKPFVDVATKDIGHDEVDSDSFRVMAPQNARARLSVGDFRRAAAEFAALDEPRGLSASEPPPSGAAVTINSEPSP